MSVETNNRYSMRDQPHNQSQGEITMENTEKQKPIRVFRCGGVKAAVLLGTVKKNGKDVNV